MEPSFWLERWQRNEIGFHQAAPHAGLARFWSRLELPGDARVFVPLAGKSLDLVWLAAQGHDVVGIELSPEAVRAFADENGPVDRVDLRCGDLFDLTPAALGPVAGVFDRASLVALPPDLRRRYAAQLAALTPPGARTLLVSMEYDQAKMSGPPHAVHEPEVHALFGDTHAVELLAREASPDLPRFAARGVDALSEAFYLLTRLIRRTVPHRIPALEVAPHPDPLPRGGGEGAWRGDPPRARVCRVVGWPDPAPVAAVARAWRDDPHLLLLDGRANGQWAILGVDPTWAFRCRDGQAWFGAPGQEAPVAGAPLEVLAAVLRRFALAPVDPVPDEAAALPFRGGAIGFLAYELLAQIEAVPAAARDDRPVPDAWLVGCDAALVEDLSAGRTWLVANGFGATAEEARAAADARLAALQARLSRTVLPLLPDPVLAPRARLTEAALAARGIVAELPGPAYRALVARAREHILAGDAFEICTSARFLCPDVPAAALVDAVRAVNPAPFGAWLRLPGLDVVSASPERFLRVDRAGWAETSPIKGTRPRGATPDEDARLARELATSEKDLAENVMIVDLARSDLGRVCALGTVHVPELQAVHSFAFTHQLVSTVRGHLRPGIGPVDVLRATFPGGSMTGAPKVEATKIIAALEPVRRGVFAGAVGYFDYEGALDLSIVIRTFVRHERGLTFHVGGAVVADSDPAEEHQEILDKAAGLVAALDLAGVPTRDAP